MKYCKIHKLGYLLMNEGMLISWKISIHASHGTPLHFAFRASWNIPVPTMTTYHRACGQFQTSTATPIFHFIGKWLSCRIAATLVQAVSLCGLSYEDIAQSTAVISVVDVSSTWDISTIRFVWSVCCISLGSHCWTGGMRHPDGLAKMSRGWSSLMVHRTAELFYSEAPQTLRDAIFSVG